MATTITGQPDSSVAAKATSDREWVIYRVFDASRELVWQAWTDPKLMAQWWGPRAFANPVCELDVRPGGAYRIVMRSSDGVEYPVKGVYHEVAEPERLVMSVDCSEHPAEWQDLVKPSRAKGEDNPAGKMQSTVSLEDVGGKTRLTIRMRFESAAIRDALLKIGMNEGWNESLERLEPILAKARAEIRAPVDRPEMRQATPILLRERTPTILKRLFCVPEYSASGHAGLLLIRVVAGLAFTMHGWAKIQNPFGWMGPEGFAPPVLQALAAVSEFGGGLAWILGLVTPLACLGIASTMTVAFCYHTFMRGDPFVSKTGEPSSELAAAYFCIALLLLAMGPGRFSLDKKLFGSRQRLLKPREAGDD
jgi:uncharacterized protein YndB with AHSA1/START domain/uncharacterized membrane protein YphA (DoxX/SURF4 family)